MKVKQDGDEFKPVTIVLETKEELEAVMRSLFESVNLYKNSKVWSETKEQYIALLWNMYVDLEFTK